MDKEDFSDVDGDLGEDLAEEGFFSDSDVEIEAEMAQELGYNIEDSESGSDGENSENESDMPNAGNNAYHPISIDINSSEEIAPREATKEWQPVAKERWVFGNDRKFSEMETRAEGTTLIAVRASNISKGEPSLIPDFDDPNPRNVAREAFRRGLCPLGLKRPAGFDPDGTPIFEIIMARELTGTAIHQIYRSGQ